MPYLVCKLLLFCLCLHRSLQGSTSNNFINVTNDESDDDFEWEGLNTAPFRIIYNVGNMANDIEQARQFLSNGANALEVDIQYHSNGEPLNIFHGFPCDCFRNCGRSSEIEAYFDFLRVKTQPGTTLYSEQLAILLLDLHLDGVDFHHDPLYAAGTNIANLVIKHIYANGTGNSTLKIIVDIPRVRYLPTFHGFRDAFKRINTSHLLEKIGYSVREEENLDEIQQMFRGMDIDDHIWQGDGVSNCVVGRSDARLRRALVKRDVPQGAWTHISKVFKWTIDTKGAMRNALRIGVDGIVSNDPDDVLAVIREKEFLNRLRLATAKDDPFEKIEGAGPLRTGCNSNYCWRDCTFSGRWCWTEMSGCNASPEQCTLKQKCSSACRKRHFPKFVNQAIKTVSSFFRSLQVK